ncbi:MAG: hypothetical protein KAG97_08870 [Victivallales bacterium]|nr:hypothetical protein [Victivallales bacterium]
MKQWFRQFSAVSGNTFTVLMGDPLTLIVHVLIIGLTLVIACMPGFSNIGGQLKLVRDQSLALSFMALCLLAAVGVGKALCDDMSKGMMPTIMSRPVSHSALILGKWAGVMSTIFLVIVTATVACLWTTRIIHYRLRIESLGLTTYLAVVAFALLAPAIRHYWKGGNYMWQTNLALAVLFPVAFLVLNFWGFEGAGGSAYGALVDWRSALSFAYIFMPLLVFTAILMFLATTMDVSLLMICAALLFFGGLFSAYLVNLLFASNTLKALIWVFTPNWQLYWLSDDLSSSNVLSQAYLLPRLLNAIIQPALFLSLGIANFKRLEIKGSV